METSALASRVTVVVLRALRSSAGACLFLFALCAGPLRAQQAPTIVERTAHYSIDVEGEGGTLEAEAREFGVVLEEAWKAYAALLRCEPVQAKPAQFRVRVFANRASWLAALSASGITPPADLDFLYFQPERDTLLLFRHPSRWFTRRLVLHGAFQQFHCRAKSKHVDLVNTWFVLGLAEQLSQHRWDGKILELAAHPRISVLDLPRQATKALESGLGLKTFVEAGLRRPALSWALVGFLREGKGGKYSTRFDKLALGQTGSKLTGAEFAGSLGKPEQICGELQTWLASVQEPLLSSCGDWEDLNAHALAGRASADDFAFAVVRAPSSDVQARIVCEIDSAAGLLLAFQDNQHYAFATLSDRGIVVQHCDGSKLSTVGEYQSMPSTDGTHRLRARRMDERVTLFSEERELASFALEGEQLGFAVEKGGAQFLDPSWK